MKRLALACVVLFLGVGLLQWVLLKTETSVACFLCPQKAVFIGTLRSEEYREFPAEASAPVAIVFPTHRHIWVQDGYRTRKGLFLEERADGHAPRLYRQLLDWEAKIELAEVEATAPAAESLKKAWKEFLAWVVALPDPRGWYTGIREKAAFKSLNGNPALSAQELEVILSELRR